jgi:hypothetical protein
MDQTIRRQLEDEGFARLKVRSSAWSKPFGDKFILLHLEKGPKQPYLKPVGGKFSVWLHLVESATVREATYETCISFLHYFAESDLTEMKQIRQRILRKILSQTTFDSDVDRVMLELHGPLMEAGFDDSLNRNQPWPLEYLDADDVLAWGRFIASKVPQSVAGIITDNKSIAQK